MPRLRMRSLRRCSDLPVALDFQPILKLKVDAVGAGGQHGDDDNDDSQRIVLQRPHPYRISYQRQKEQEGDNFKGVYKLNHKLKPLIYSPRKKL
jgi:hypothetical protein